MWLKVVIGFLSLSFPINTSAIRVVETLKHSSFESRLLAPAFKTIEFANDLNSVAQPERQPVVLSFNKGGSDKEAALHSIRATRAKPRSSPDVSRNSDYLLSISAPAETHPSSPSQALPVVLSVERLRDAAALGEREVEEEKIGTQPEKFADGIASSRPQPTSIVASGVHHIREEAKVRHLKLHDASISALTGLEIKPVEPRVPPDLRIDQSRARERHQKQQQPQAQNRPVDEGTQSGRRHAPESRELLNTFWNVLSLAQSQQDGTASRDTGMFAALRRRLMRTQPQQQNADSTKEKNSSIFKQCLPESTPEDCQCEPGYYFNGWNCTSVALTDACNPGIAIQRILNTYTCSCPTGYIEHSITVELPPVSPSTTSSTSTEQTARQQSSATHQKSLLMARCVANPCYGHRRCSPGRCIPDTENLNHLNEAMEYHCQCPSDYASIRLTGTNREFCRDRSQLLCGIIEEGSCGPPELVDKCKVTSEGARCKCRFPGYLNPYTEKCTQEPICNYMPCGSSKAVAACFAGPKPGTWRCQCNQGFTVVGGERGRMRCSQIDHCARNPCGPSEKVAKCISSPFGYTCRCRTGYVLRRRPTSSVCE